MLNLVDADVVTQIVWSWLANILDRSAAASGRSRRANLGDTVRT
jgi:hypothetical protein